MIVFLYFAIMQSTLLVAYQNLKKAVAQKACENHPNLPKKMSEWKGKAIATFQDELAQTVNGRVSEKWFYTHLKSEEISKLPRQDMLDLLSRFVGYENWQTFIATQTSTHQETRSSKSTWIKVTLALLVISLLGLSFKWLYFKKDNYHYQACLVDTYLQQAIKQDGLQVFNLLDHESPIPITLDSLACFEVHSNTKQLRLYIKGPYYKPDTIVRTLYKKETQEQIQLMPDDYALMIHYFSNAKIDDWQRRKKQLQEMFSNNAMVFQVDYTGMGMEMYNKEEFINKLVIPLNSLKNIRILETVYDPEGKIQKMRFIQEK